MSEQSDFTADIAVDAEQAPGGKLLVARYGLMGNLGVFGYDLESLPVPGTNLVLRTSRGAELGKVLMGISEQPGLFQMSMAQVEKYLVDSGPEYPLTRGGRVLRIATPQDLNDQAHLDKSAAEESAYCRQQIAQHGLQMRLVAVEHVLGGERIIFYFTAEQRVDFRELVRALAGQYHTRIEMRQVGARDEARLVADYERCGRRCCCQEYMKLLKPVSMRMAKCQKATLDPAKISGRCGRLMCCLRYEDQTYDDLQARLPRKNIWVRTADGIVGRVIDAQILTQLVRLMVPNGSPVVVANDEIVERNVPEPPPAPERERRPERPRPARAPLAGQRLAEQAATAGPEADGPDAAEPDLDESGEGPTAPAEAGADDRAAAIAAVQDNEPAGVEDGPEGVGPGAELVTGGDDEAELDDEANEGDSGLDADEMADAPPPGIDGPMTAETPQPQQSPPTGRSAERGRRGRRRRRGGGQPAAQPPTHRHPEALTAPPRTTDLPSPGNQQQGNLSPGQRSGRRRRRRRRGNGGGPPAQ